MLESMFKECGFRCRCEGCSRVYRAIEESWDDSTFPGRGVYKGQDGTSVLPFRASEAKWLLREFGGDRGTFCWWCGKDSGDDAGGVELQTCAQCKVMRYCGKACQKSSWQASHKGLCTTMIEWREKGELG
ncbi:hypothetical protein M427DRAFT_368829 [Gonapodya prolifera JEL478]|uniref:MYND-type domain-containing protein n=1 Tax=Gonapodya prolifera (strain JEL478) TaxID=1344416 RepID=A0A139A9K0_GONPJ|nr:hypothetical protein M427DRAFT_368829 [Gonapodya prolifera JEL478]|eukprot:KXS13502.1 hypothetical protein M427DRAFT_368829 [Gonapodya prolifera JEL478]